MRVASGLRNFVSRRPRLVLAVGLIAVCSGVWAWQALAEVHYTPEMVAEGKVLFTHEWQPGDSLAAGGDGLGPVFNAKSCVACHFQGGTGGAGPNSVNVMSFEVPPADGRPTVHTGSVHVAAVDASSQETRRTVEQVYPDSTGDIQFHALNTPALFGLGELNRVSDGVIKRKRWSRSLSSIGSELKGDFTATTVGKVRSVPGGVGKFGWKGQFASVEQFVATACAVEMGLSNPLVKQHAPGKFAESADAKLDLDEEQFLALVAFVETLPRPQQVLPTESSARRRVENGQELFASVGCADCHTPDVDDVTGVYCDFLIYSLEEAESGSSGYGPPKPDPFPWPEDTPESDEWQTPPLWGVADSAPYFHDGESPTLAAAIARHGGAAHHVRERYRNLDRTEKDDLISFLKSLRAPQIAK